MRGIMFTEFTAFAEEKFGLVACQKVLDQAALSTDGSYTNVGNYPYSDLEAIVVTLVDMVDDLDAEQLLFDFGYWLAGRFRTSYASFFEEHDNALSFLASIDDHIHVEVRKLYPDSVPPRVFLTKESDDRYVLRYESHRPLAAVALGLTQGSLDAFGGVWRIVEKQVASAGNEMTLALVPARSKADVPAD